MYNLAFTSFVFCFGSEEELKKYIGNFLVTSSFLLSSTGLWYSGLSLLFTERGRTVTQTALFSLGNFSELMVSCKEAVLYSSSLCTFTYSMTSI